jgi:hypothetical protein
MACEALFGVDKVGHEGKGRLIFVMGSPRAGVSALAKKLQQSAKKRGIRSLDLGEAPWGSAVNIRNRYFRSLNLPLIVDEFWSNELASRPYEAVHALRAYQAIFVDDGHDYFLCNKSVRKRNFERLIQLAEGPAKPQVFIFGLSEVLVPIAIKFTNAGYDVIQYFLRPMPEDSRYHQFVGELMRHNRFDGGQERATIDISTLHRLSNGSVGVTADFLRDFCAGLLLT